ncbi:docking protein 1 [Adelges cooleyi]|uniref:docking protein 1 n=1 Tax=Adelges cooleyi TaxID=133065 RepID=UPI00218050AF|nr:docking protein 1 [Adelges cooleyi]
MGGVYGSRRPPSVFKVINVDEKANVKYYGKMEITAFDIILHKNGGSKIIWPLHTVRKYGFESSTFFFEAGRLAPHGQGVFAFKTKDAKHIFNTVREKLKSDKFSIEAKDKSSEVGTYSGQSYTSTHTIEKVYDENGESNNNNQPPDLMLDPDTVCITYMNTLIDHNKEYDNVLNDPFESPNKPIYIKVEICSPKERIESLPTSPTEIPGYTAIDHNLTKHLSQKMLKNSEDVGMRKTRHDSTMSNP